jgi:hypothetical protein
MKMREANAVLKLLYGYKLTRRKVNIKNRKHEDMYKYKLIDSAGNLPYGSIGLCTHPLEKIVQWIIDAHYDSYNELP